MLCPELCDLIIYVLCILCGFRLFKHFQFLFTTTYCNWLYILVFVVVVVNCIPKGGALWGWEGYSVFRTCVLS